MGISIIKNQSGRSMIEMLGVLAIIGVLSVGGLVGYSKAMERYRVNETINQVTHIVQNTRDLFKTQPNLYGGMSFDNKYMSVSTYENRILADKAKLFPEVLVKNDYKNLYGGDIRFYADGRFSADDGKAFILMFQGVPQESCIELATRDWQSSLGLIAMRIRGSGAEFSTQRTYMGNCTSDYEQGDARICGNDMPITLEHAVSASNNEKNNYVYWKFY